jgi:hypothetical protein
MEESSSLREELFSLDEIEASISASNFSKPIGTDGFDGSILKKGQ